ncbi:MAG TPA: ATP-binding protein, partial [Actinomycetota bacterium]|nr:ATP-binding protein [Actinomycetota bacterium]
SLRARLTLAALYVLAVVAVGLEIPLAVTISASETRQFKADVLTNTSLLAARINDDVPKAGVDPATPPRPPAVIDQLVERTAAGTALPSLRFVVTDALGRVLADSADEATVGETYATADRPEFNAVLHPAGDPIAVDTRHSDTLGQDLLVVAVPVVHNRGVAGVVRATVPLGSVQARIHRTWAGLAAIGALAVLAGLVATWFLATTLVRPVRRLEGAAVDLGSGDLEARAPVDGPKELATLARSFNRMADALASNVSAQRDFLAYASHQLRTPLTGLRLRLEAIRADGGPQAEQATKAEAEVDRLAALVEDLLTLARAASAETTGSVVDLADASRRAAARWKAQAKEEGTTLVDEGVVAAPVWADPGDLDHLLDNLIENAIRYTPAGSTVRIRAGAASGHSFLEVSDDGPGITTEDAERIFERFYRGSTGRRSGTGTGLGLAIAWELARRWDGALTLADTDGRGATFVATFPAQPAVS